MRTFIQLWLMGVLCIIIHTSCKSQLAQHQGDLEVGGAFENRDLFFESQPSVLHPVDTSPVWSADAPRLLLTGTVFQCDDHTPASDIVIYYYHTDAKGLYTKHPLQEEAATQHGYIRGWVKTDADGRYAIYTSRPGAYPSWTEPAHIHLTVKEPGLTPYWIDSVVFQGDSLLTPAYQKRQGNRGGSGIIQLKQEEGTWIGEHNITLGLHIPEHPCH
ncbi:MAG: intradiol ring-cleavage dioxygenase [Saprospiraceae bacterium]|nr:intradiol ring-cleavage dioxygenase [Saprospiraceae bacterium]